MEVNYIEQLKQLFKNLALNAIGAERDLYKYIDDGDIYKAVGLMDDNSREVDKAIEEYNVQTHRVMNRHDKDRVGKDPYISEKLPRNRAVYINEIELFFLLGKPILWKKEEGDDEAYKLFVNYLRDIRFDSKMRQAKRIAGSETESAFVFELTKRADGSLEDTPYIAARSTGYKIRPMFDQYGRMMALAIGYTTREGNLYKAHWDIHTAQLTYKCVKEKLGWTVDKFNNPTEKINAVYFHQKKAWDGAVPRIEREEMLDSKLADTNNYFADPIAQATADVIQGLADPDKPGRIIQLTGKSSQFSYVNPPQNSVTRETERKNLNDSILFDTFTPDFSYDQMRGLGSLSGAAMHNALIIGYIKRDNRIEVYGEMVSRLKNVIIGILKLKYPDKAADFDKLVITFEFSEPFDSDKREMWNSIISLYGGGLMSLETAVRLLSVTDAPDDEIARIQMAQQEAQQAAVEAAEQAQAVKEGTQQQTEEEIEVKEEEGLENP